MRNRRQLVLAVVAALAVVLAIWTAILIEGRSFSLAENLILCERSRPSSVWEFVETPRGTLIRARNGRFSGWYLAADDSVNASEWTADGIPGVSDSDRRPHVRNLCLRETRDADGYWRVSKSTLRGLHHIQTTGGRYEGWYLDYLESYPPDTGGDPRTAWNLALTPEIVKGSHWRLESTAGGRRIRATSGAFSDWCLDYLEDANVLERRRDESVPRRDAQTPPVPSPGGR